MVFWVMNAVMANGQVMQGLVNRRSREKDVFQQIKPVFPELSPEADLATAQKFAALNLLLETRIKWSLDPNTEALVDTVGSTTLKKAMLRKLIQPGRHDIVANIKLT